MQHSDSLKTLADALHVSSVGRKNAECTYLSLCRSICSESFAWASCFARVALLGRAWPSCPPLWASMLVVPAKRSVKVTLLPFLTHECWMRHSPYHQDDALVHAMACLQGYPGVQLPEVYTSDFFRISL